MSMSCFVPKNNPDEFYSAWVDWGSPRFPLIKPYAAFYVSENAKWSINLLVPRSRELNHYLNITEIEKVAVNKDVIIVYTSHSQKTGPNDPLITLYWFVIIPNQEIERGFDNETDFIEFIAKYGIEDVKWETPDDINRRFLDTGCLDWIPGCTKQ